ncbi:transposase [Xanthovirga aplysinae]
MLLRSVPGIGPIVACGILSEVGDLRRFDNFKTASFLCRFGSQFKTKWG